MFCEKCGSEIIEGSLYCSQCGQSVENNNSFGNTEDLSIETTSFSDSNTSNVNLSKDYNNMNYNNKENDNIQKQYNGQATFNALYNNQQQVKNNSIAFGIAAMVLGILSIILSCTMIVSGIAGILSIVFGIIQMRKCEGKGFALAGIITGAIGIFISIFFVVCVIIGYSVENSSYSNYGYDSDNYFEDFNYNSELDELDDYLYSDM